MPLVISRGRLLILVLMAATVVGAALWFFHPARMLDRSWRGLLQAVENRSVLALRGHLAPDYADRWGYDRESILVDARLAFRELTRLELVTRDVRVVRDGVDATISARLHLEIEGTDSARQVRDRVNGFADPFNFEFRREPGVIGTWRLVRFDHPEFDPQTHRRTGLPGF